jgi:hypothetical protein
MKQMLAENCEQGEGPMIDIPVINDSHVEIEEN